MQRWVSMCSLMALWLGGLSLAEAGPVRLNFTGTVKSLSGSTTLGYSMGQTVTYFLTVATGNAAGGPGQWYEEDTLEPKLWANAGGTGLTGVYAKAPGRHPYERLFASYDANTGESRLQLDLNTDSPSPTANHGIVSAVNPAWFLKKLLAGDYFLALPLPDPLPATPTATFSGVFGTYAAKLTGTVTNEIQFQNSSGQRVTIGLNPVSLSIGAEPRPIPEPSSCVLIGLGALVIASRARRASTRLV